MSLADAIAALAADGDFMPLVRLMERRQQLHQRKGPGRKKAATDATTDAVDDLEQQVRELPGETLDKLYPEAIRRSSTVDTTPEHLDALQALAQLATVLVDTKDAAISPARVFAIAQNLHGQLLRLRGDPEIVPRVQDAIAMLCESCWKRNFHNAAHSLVTQLLPYLIVRSYECPASGSFASRKHPVRRLYAIKDALELLDFEDESSGLLRDILLRCYIQPNLFRSPDAIAFLSFLFELHLPFIDDIDATIRNQLPHQRRAIVAKYGSIYFRAWVGSAGNREARDAIERNCIQRYVHDAVHARTTSLFAAVRSVLHVFCDNKRHTGVDEMLYRVCSPILWRGVKAAHDSVRRQAAVLLFDTFPLRDPQFTAAQMDATLQRQFDAFEELLGDSHPAVRIAAVQGVAKVLSVYWELLPAETIRCFLSKLVVDLVHDAASSSVRAAVFEGLQFILDNHNAHSILKPLLPMLAPLINDRNERVRAEFAALLVRIKSIRNLHFYDVVSVDELLARLVRDRDRALVRKQLVALFLNSYFPQSVGGSSQVARCLALVKKNPEAAIVFYGSVADHASVGSVCKLAALLLRCSLNFVSRRLEDAASGSHKTKAKAKSKATRVRSDDDDDDDGDEDDDNDDDDEGFSVVGQVVVLEVISALLSSVHTRVMTDPRYAECRAFVAEQLPAASIEALLVAYSSGKRAYDDDALSAVWKLVGFLGELSESALLEHLVQQLMAMDEATNRRLLESMVNCLASWQQLPFLVAKLVRFLHDWKDRALSSSSDTVNAKANGKSKASTKAFTMNPIVVLGAVEYIASAPSVQCSAALMDQLFVALQRCVAPILELDASQLLALYRAQSFRLLRLLEVFAKFAVLAASARVAHRAAALLEPAAAKRLRDSDDLAALQPSMLFEPPEALAALSQWVTRLLPALRDSAHDANVANLAGKRRRGKRSTAASDDDADDREHSPPQQLLARWRNLFALIALLTTECVAFAFEAAHVSDQSAVSEFVDGCVDDFVEALDDEGPRLERVVFYHACQLLFLLRSLVAKANTKAKTKTKATQQQSASKLMMLERWSTRLHDALARAHAKHEDTVDDLWSTLTATTTDAPLAAA